MSKGFGRIEKRRQQLESRNDLLIELNRFIPWEIFRSCLDKLPKQARKSNAGRKAIDLLLLFKLLSTSINCFYSQQPNTETLSLCLSFSISLDFSRCP